MKKVTLKKVGVMSVAKLCAAMYALFGVVAGLLITIATLVAGPASDATGFESLLFGIGSIITLPIFYGIFGFIGAAIGTWIFNFIAPRVGGIVSEFETNDQ